MKLLILSCNAGQGHNSAAKALKECFDGMGHICHLKDTLTYSSKFLSKQVSSSYDRIVLHTPGAFGASYKMFKRKKYKQGKPKSAVYAMNMSYSKQIYVDILRNGYDAVICTHVFAAQALTHIKHKRALRLPVFMIATDYSFCPYFDELDVDAIFVSMKEVCHEYTDRGIADSKVIPTGIPVSPRIASDISKSQAKEKLCVSPDTFLCVVMCGGMGFGNVYEMIEELESRNLPKHNIFVMAGSNKKLYNGINSRYSDNDSVKAFGFTNDIPLYMKAADLIISKPGGLSSTESMASNVPLILSSPIPGCESENFDLLVKMGLAYDGSTPQKAADSFEKLAIDSSASEEMVLNQQKHINRNAASDICNYVITHINNK